MFVLALFCLLCLNWFPFLYSSSGRWYKEIRQEVTLKFDDDVGLLLRLTSCVIRLQTSPVYISSWKRICHLNEYWFGHSVIPYHGVQIRHFHRFLMLNHSQRDWTKKIFKTIFELKVCYWEKKKPALCFVSLWVRNATSTQLLFLFLTVVLQSGTC